MICVCERSITFRAIHVTEGFPGRGLILYPRVSLCLDCDAVWSIKGGKTHQGVKYFNGFDRSPGIITIKVGQSLLGMCSADCFSCFSVMFICCCFATGKVRRAANQWFDWPREISSPLFRSVVADDDMYNWCSIAVTVTRSLLMKNTINGRLLDRYSSLSVSDT